MSVNGKRTFRPKGLEFETSLAAARIGLPVMLVGPTGSGKTRLVEDLAAELDRPLVTVVCHEDLGAPDLLGRHIIRDGDVEWSDGPVTRAVREGAVCYLDEIIEARGDTLTALHSLSDHRRSLHLERTGESIEAPDGFVLIASYNPGVQGIFKQLRPSFRQRFITVKVDYLENDDEAAVIVQESGISMSDARKLAHCAHLIRQAAAQSEGEPPSTRSLVNTARLLASGFDEQAALQAGLITNLMASTSVETGVRELLRAIGIDGLSGVPTK